MGPEGNPEGRNIEGTIEGMKRRMVAEGRLSHASPIGASSPDGDGEALLLRFDPVRQGGVRSVAPLSGYMAAVLHVRRNMNRTPDVLRRDGAAE